MPMNEQQKLFVKVFVYEFTRELLFLSDVVAGRAQRRTTITDTLIKLLGSVIDKTPLAGDIANAAILALGHWHDWRRGKEIAHIGSIQDEIDPQALKILTEIVAREILRRYDYFITTRLTENHAEGVIPLAKCAVHRILEYLARTRSAINVNTMLLGLIKGRTGSLVDGLFCNADLKGKGVYAETTLYGESVFARSAFRTLDGNLWIRRTKKKKSLYSYGFSDFRSSKPNQPRNGYALVPQTLVDYYAYQRHQPSGEDKIEVDQHPISVHHTTKEEVRAYLDQRSEVGALYNYICSLHRGTKEVICSEDLTGLVLADGNFSNCDLSNTRIDGDLSRANFDNCYLIGATFSNICGEGASFLESHCHYTLWTDVKVTSFNFGQAQFDFAVFNDVHWKECPYPGASWYSAKINELRLTDKNIDYVLPIKKLEDHLDKVKFFLIEYGITLDDAQEKIQQHTITLEQHDTALSRFPQQEQRVTALEQQLQLLKDKPCLTNALQILLKQFSESEDKDSLNNALYTFKDWLKAAKTDIGKILIPEEFTESLIPHLREFYKFWRQNSILCCDEMLFDKTARYYHALVNIELRRAKSRLGDIFSTEAHHALTHLYELAFIAPMEIDNPFLISQSLLNILALGDASSVNIELLTESKYTDIALVLARVLRIYVDLEVQQQIEAIQKNEYKERKSELNQLLKECMQSLGETLYGFTGRQKLLSILSDRHIEPYNRTVITKSCNNIESALNRFHLRKGNENREKYDLIVHELKQTIEGLKAFPQSSHIISLLKESLPFESYDRPLLGLLKIAHSLFKGLHNLDYVTLLKSRFNVSLICQATEKQAKQAEQLLFELQIELAQAVKEKKNVLSYGLLDAISFIATHALLTDIRYQAFFGLTEDAEFCFGISELIRPKWSQHSTLSALHYLAIATFKNIITASDHPAFDVILQKLQSTTLISGMACINVEKESQQVQLLDLFHEWVIDIKYEKIAEVTLTAYLDLCLKEIITVLSKENGDEAQLLSWCRRAHLVRATTLWKKWSELSENIDSTRDFSEMLKNFYIRLSENAEPTAKTTYLALALLMHLNSIHSSQDLQKLLNYTKFYNCLSYVEMNTGRLDSSNTLGIAPRGLKFQEISGTDHSLFCTIGFCLGKEVSALRKEVADYLEEHIDDLHHYRTDSRKHMTEGKKIDQTPSLVGAVAGRQYNFLEKRVIGNGDCGFIAIGATRPQVVECLIALATNPEVRTQLAEEILQAFEQHFFEIETIEMNAFIINKAIDLLELRSKEQDTLSNLWRNLREQHPDWQNQLGQEQSQQESQFILWLETHGFSEHACFLKTQQVNLQEAVKQLKDYCMQQDVYENYINALGERLWLGYYSALLYAKDKKINLYIWRKNEEGNLTLMHSNESDQATNIFHILHTDGFTHFNLLVEQEPFLSNSSSIKADPYAAFREYIEDIRQGRYWKDPIELELIQKVIGNLIVVINSKSNPIIFGVENSEAPIFIYCNKNNGYDAFVIETGYSSEQVFKDIKSDIAIGKIVTFNPGIELLDSSSTPQPQSKNQFSINLLEYILNSVLSQFFQHRYNLTLPENTKKLDKCNALLSKLILTFKSIIPNVYWDIPTFLYRHLSGSVFFSDLLRKTIQETISQYPDFKPDWFFRWEQSCLKLIHPIDAATDTKTFNATLEQCVDGKFIILGKLSESVLKLLDSNGHLISNYDASKSKVNCISSAELHLKADAEFPANEIAARIFQGHLMGEWQSAQLVWFNIQQAGKLNERYPVLLTQTMPGKTLNTFVKTAEKIVDQQQRKKTSHFNPKNFKRSFSWQIIYALLIRLGDAKGSNYILSPDGTIHPIDQEELFRPAFLPEEEIKVLQEQKRVIRHPLGIKNILFCMKEMDDDLDTDVVEAFLKLSPETVLQQSLAEMAEYNRHVQSKEIKKSELKISFKSETVSQCYDDFVRLQQYLQHAKQTGKKITHRHLLGLLDPALNALYQRVFDAEETPEKCFEQLMKGLYDLVEVQEKLESPPEEAAAGTPVTTQPKTTMQYRSLRTAARFHKAQLSKSEGIEQAILDASKLDACTEFESYVATHQESLHAQLSLIKGDFKFIEKYFKPITSTHEPSFSSNAKQHLMSQIWQHVDFTAVNEKEPLIIKNMLKALGKQLFNNVRHLHLIGAKTLTDIQFTELVSHFPELSWVTLECCEMIGENSLIALAKHCPKLMVIKLEKLAALQNISSIFFSRRHYPMLIRLEVTDCINLREINIDTPQLRYLHATDNFYLQKVQTKSQVLRSINISRSIRMATQAFQHIATDWQYLKYLDISACTQIQLERVPGVWAVLQKSLRRLYAEGCYSQYHHYFDYPDIASSVALPQLDSFLRDTIFKSILKVEHLVSLDTSTSHWLLRLLSNNLNLQEIFLHYLLSHYAPDTKEQDMVYHWISKLIEKGIVMAMDFSFVSADCKQKPIQFLTPHNIIENTVAYSEEFLDTIIAFSDKKIVTTLPDDNNTNFSYRSCKFFRTQCRTIFYNHRVKFELIILANGQLLSSTGDSVTLWNLQTQQRIATHQWGNREWTSPPRAYNLVALPDGQFAGQGWDFSLSPSSYMCSIRVWNPDTWQCTANIGQFGIQGDLIILPDGQLAFNGWDNDKIYFWNYQTKRVTETTFEHRGSKLATLFDKQLISLSSESMKIWDLQTQVCLNTIKCLDIPFSMLFQVSGCGSVIFYHEPWKKNRYWSFPRTVSTRHAQSIADALCCSSSVTSLAGTEFIKDATLRQLIELRVQRNILFHDKCSQEFNYTLIEAARAVGDLEALKILEDRHALSSAVPAAPALSDDQAKSANTMQSLVAAVCKVGLLSSAIADQKSDVTSAEHTNLNTP